MQLDRILLTTSISILQYSELLINNFCRVVAEEETQRAKFSATQHITGTLGTPMIVQSLAHEASHMFTKWSFPTSTPGPESLYN